LVDTALKTARVGAVFSYENTLLTVLCVTFGMVFWNRLALNYMLPFVQADLHLSNTQAGLLVSVLSLSWAAFGLLLGAYSDRTGIRKRLLVGLTLALSLTALLSGLTSTFAMLLLARLCMGAVQGPVLPVAQSTMAIESSPHRRGLNMGVLQNFGSGVLANVIAPLVIVAVATSYGWRAGFVVSALPGFALVAALLFLMRPDPSVANVAKSAQRAAGLRGVFESRNAVLCLFITCLMVMWLMIQMTFLPGFILKAGLSSGEMSIQMSIRGISALIAGIALPALSDRIGRKPVTVAAALLSAVAPLCTALPHQTVLSLTLTGAVMGIGAGVLPLAMAIIPSESVPPRLVATALGVTMGAGELIGGFLAPVSAGAAADALGMSAPFVMAGIASIAAAVVGLVLAETRSAMRGKS
jgi:MFS transporter, ACS family, hexuronate transporter